MKQPSAPCTNSIQEQHEQRRLLTALDNLSDLKKVLQKCGTLSHTTYGWLYRCRQVACSYCRYRYARRQERAAAELVAGAAHGACSFLTVVSEGVEAVEEIGPATARLRQQLRRVVERARRRDARWNGVALKGWVEVDAVSLDLMEVIGARRQQQLVGLGVQFGTEPTWIVTAHALIRHDHLDRESVSTEFKRKWPKDERLRLTSLSEHQSLQTATGNLVRYSLKNSCTVNIEGGVEKWPLSWRATYFEWLSSWSKSFKRLSVSVRTKNSVSDDKYSYPSITGAGRNVILKPKFIERFMLRQADEMNFDVASTHAMCVSFDFTPERLGYRAAREWCARACVGRWSYAARRSERDSAGASPVEFAFESVDDAAAFRVAASSGAFEPRPGL